MAQTKAQNDPWSTLPEKTAAVLQPPADPRYQLIDSGRYIESLEKKLKHINGKHRPEPSSRDIINSLACFHSDQMQRFMDMDQCFSTSATSLTDQTATSSLGSASYIQRRLHPERQAIDMEELFELLKDDELAKNRAEEDDKEGRNYCGSEIQSEQTYSAEELKKDPQNIFVEVGGSCEETCAAVREVDSNEGER